MTLEERIKRAEGLLPVVEQRGPGTLQALELLKEIVAILAVLVQDRTNKIEINLK